MNQHTSVQQKQQENQQKYERTQMQREIVIQRLKEQGCRITKQRMVLLDIILNENCSSCKEIYYKASKIDPKIGTATVYRMINTLEEIGAISRRNMYKIDCDKDDSEDLYTSNAQKNKLISAIKGFSGNAYEIVIYTANGGEQLATFGITLDSSVIEGQKGVESITTDKTELVF